MRHLRTAILFASILSSLTKTGNASELNSESFRVTSFNFLIDFAIDKWLWDDVPLWSARKDAVISALKEIDFDILGAQELFSHQANDVCNNLNAYQCVRHPVLTQVMLMLRKQRYQVEEFGFVGLNGRVENPYYIEFNHFIPRLALWVVAYDHLAKERILVTTAHFDARKKVRREMARRYMNWLRSFDRKAQTMIVLGDFNMEIDDPGIRFFTDKRLNLQNALLANKFASLNPKAFPSYLNLRLIDHVFFESNSNFSPEKWRLYNYEHDGVRISDHRPLVVDFHKRKSIRTKKAKKSIVLGRAAVLHSGNLLLNQNQTMLHVP